MCIHIYIYIYLGFHFPGPKLESWNIPQSHLRKQRFLSCATLRNRF